MKELDEKAKKMLLLFGGTIGLIIIIIVISLIVGALKNSSLEYSEIEDKMVSAAKDYYSKREDALPINETEEVEVSAALLVEEGYMKELSKYQKDDSVACEGKVIVSKSGIYYNYSPYLNCGDKYTTTYLYEEIIDKTVSKDDGLYKTEQYSKEKGKETVYVYKGDYVDNFIKIDDNLWRIVKVDSNYNMMLIQDYFDRENGYRGPWDDRYNSANAANTGINDYYKSVIRNKVNSYYSSDMLSDNLKAKIVSKDLCVGTRGASETKKDGSVECKQVIKEDYLGLLTIYDFMNASLDTNCKKTTDMNCNNYNYLTNYSNSFWLITADSESTFKGYKFSSGITQTRLATSGVARIVLNITKNSVYVSGNGTYNDPYIIK